MIDHRTRDDLIKLFSDAHVIDIDMSQWDKSISIWMLADHYREWAGRCPLVVVECIGVITLEMRFNTNRVQIENTNHSQWLIHDCNITDGDYTSIKLWGHSSSPIVTVDCFSVSIRETQHSLLDLLQPGWNKTSSPLARRGIEEIVRRISTLQK